MSGTRFDEGKLKRRHLLREPGTQVARRRESRECLDTPAPGKGEYVEGAFRIAAKRSAADDELRLRFVATADNAHRAIETATLNGTRKRKRG